MEWRGLLRVKETTLLLSPSLQPTPHLNSQPPSDLESDVFKLSSKVSPSVLLIIIILAIIFFVSGLLHLLVRFLVRPTSYRDPDDLDINVTALQGQLQQLFHLHDAGVDQTYIDTLPVFLYKAIIGLKKNCPFDCAVCLCEFESEDKLRLLPKCSHAFHTDCIDTWLLSHSTCPLCRTSLFPPDNRAPSSPILLLLESGPDDIGRTNSVLTSNSCASFRADNNGLGSLRFDLVSTKPCEIILDNKNNNNNCDDVAIPAATEPGSAEKVVTVKLGKFRSVVAADDIGEGSSSSNNHHNNSSTIDARRCYSMGSFEYIMDENSSLQVPIRTPMKKQSSKKPSLPLTPGHRPAMSECDCESGRDFLGLDAIKSSLVSSRNENNVSTKSKRESFSISKIWARKDKERIPTEKDGSTSRRAFSFRSAISRSGVAAADESDDMKQKNIDRSAWRTNSEMGVGRWKENGGSNELRYCCDVENQRDSSSGSDGSNINRRLESEQKTPSFARKTLQWLVSRQSKVVHSSLPPTV